MTPFQEQLVALGGIFQAAVTVDKLATTGQLTEGPASCLINSLLVPGNTSTIEVYGGDDFQLLDGYRAIVAAFGRQAAVLPRDILRYSLSMIMLERKLMKRSDMLDQIASRLDHLRNQVSHFGPTHANVLAACGGLYQDTLSTFPQRIQVHGDMHHLQQSNTATAIRAMLMAGIRSATLWQQRDGRRWQLIFSRGKIVRELQQRLHD